MNCKAQFGINNVCGDLLMASGVDKDWWAGYVSDLSVRFDLTQSGIITSIQFIPYNGLVKFEGQKFAHQFSYEVMKGAGGALSYIHKSTVKVLNLSTQDDLEVQRLTQAQDMFQIFQDNNEFFYIVAPSKGLQIVAGALRTSGVAAGEDVATALSFEGNEKVLPLRFSAGTTAQTVALLNSYVR